MKSANLFYQSRICHSRDELPNYEGIYVLADGCEIVYIGQSTRIRSRLYKHHSYYNPLIHSVLVWYEPDAIKRLELEKQMIKKYNPVYNTIYNRFDLLK